MKFSYFKVAKDKERPIMKVEITYGSKTLSYFALVDSGADINIFHVEVGEALGINIETGDKGYISGITSGESQPYYTHPVILKVGGWEYKTTVSFMKKLSKNGYGLLGQKDFFNLFKSISFNYNKKEIEIIKN